MVSFTRVFPAHDFGNRQTYKITNTGVDGPCPYYKIKNIAFEQKKIRSLDVFWILFWISLGLLDGHKKYQELGFPTDCGEKSGENSIFPNA